MGLSLRGGDPVEKLGSFQYLCDHSALHARLSARTPLDDSAVLKDRKYTDECVQHLMEGHTPVLASAAPTAQPTTRMGVALRKLEVPSDPTAVGPGLRALPEEVWCGPVPN